MDTSAKVAVIAALEREVRPLVRDWRVLGESASSAGPTFVHGDTVVVCAGVGANAAARAAELAISRFNPSLLISAGLAGALKPDLQIGSAVIPATVISSSSGTRFQTADGNGTLVTASGVAGPEGKRLLARQHAADLVDMEAAVVAAVAKNHNVDFMAVKAVSDDLDFAMPDFAPFVDDEGRFLIGRFSLHLALRPRLWPVVRQLSANSARAAAELCTVLKRVVQEKESQYRSGPAKPVASEKRLAF